MINFKYKYIEQRNNFCLYKCSFQGCNSNSFVKITKSTMNALAIANRKTRHIEMCHSKLVDEATGFSSEEDYDDDYPRAPVSYTRKWEVCKYEQGHFHCHVNYNMSVHTFTILF